MTYLLVWSGYYFWARKAEAFKTNFFQGVPGGSGGGSRVLGDHSTMGIMSMMVPALPDNQDNANDHDNDESDDDWSMDFSSIFLL